MNNDIVEQKNHFAIIGVLMIIISLMFLFYMGSSMLSATKEYMKQTRGVEMISE